MPLLLALALGLAINSTFSESERALASRRLAPGQESVNALWRDRAETRQLELNTSNSVLVHVCSGRELYALN